MIARLLVLFSLAPVFLCPAQAQTLVGDWYQESLQSGARKAFSQPRSQRTDSTQATLGIEGPGAIDPVDFYLLVSSSEANSGCLFTASRIVIDSQSFALTSTTDATDLTQLSTGNAETQQLLWERFRKGSSLTVELRRDCSTAGQASELQSFEFSLKGSQAAYRFVSEHRSEGDGSQSIPAPEPSARRLESPPVESPDAAQQDDSGYAYIGVVVGVVLVGLLFYLLFGQRSKPSSGVPAGGQPGVRIEPRIGAPSGVVTKPAQAGAGKPPSLEPPVVPTPGQFQDISAYPAFKVEHVIDGNSIILSSSLSEKRVRLDSIDCPQDGQEWGEAAKAGLLELIGGKRVRLEALGSDRFEQTLGTLYVHNDADSGWMNVNETMLMLGHAWVRRACYKHLPEHRRERLNTLEKWARSRSVGLWSRPDPVPPWEWRKDGD
jgi:endonuclease YncB( thermonuclease family)